MHEVPISIIEGALARRRRESPSFR